MALRKSMFGEANASMALDPDGQVTLTAGEPGSNPGSLVVGPDGCFLSGRVNLENKPNTPGEMAVPFPFDHLPLSPQAIFMPPMMDLLPMLPVVVGASAGILALDALRNNLTKPETQTDTSTSRGGGSSTTSESSAPQATADIDGDTLI